MTRTQELLNALEKELTEFGELNQSAGITALDASALVQSCLGKIAKLKLAPNEEIAEAVTEKVKKLDAAKQKKEDKE